MLFYSIVVFILVVKNKFANTSPIANKGLDNVRYQLDNEDEYTFKDYKKEAEVFDQILRANKEATGLDDGLLFEGDIEITDHKTDSFYDKKDKRNAQRSRVYLWHNKVVPYEFDKGAYSPDDKQAFNAAFRELEANSCIKFVPHTNQVNWIKFVRGNGCFSAIGRSFWKLKAQELSIGDGCVTKGIIMHEVLHALGFYHEQSRVDRHDYVEIFWENIEPSQYHNFQKLRSYQVDNQKILYDYESIMHYSEKAFSINGKKTIVPIKQGFKIGNRHHLSAKDIMELNLLYDCKSNSSDFMSQWSSFGPCNNQCNKHRERYCSHPDLKHCPRANLNGIEEEIGTCSLEECYAPVDGHWGRWSDWSPCSVTCGNGIRTRTRPCDNPAPLHQGKSCVGGEQSRGSCMKANCSLGVDDCDFEDGTCHWKVASTDYLWSIQQGETPTKKTGPSHDHSYSKTNFGHYIYAESSAPAKTGMEAKLISKVFKAVKNRCMKFWYHTFGVGISKLEVILQPTKNVNDIKHLWKTEGNSGDKWLKGEVDVSYDGEYEIEFVARRGASFLGDIALDDIIFESCQGQGAGGGNVEQEEYKKLKKYKLKNLGCFNDNTANKNRPFPNMVNFRNDIDWTNMNKTVNQCRDYVIAKGFQYFGIEFYGECFYGKTSEVNFSMYGPSTKCWGVVGQAHTLAVYKIYVI